MPVLHDTPEEPLPPAFPTWLMVAVVAVAGVFVYLAYHHMRSEPAWGMDGEALRTATYAVGAVFLGLMALGAWLARRQRALGRRSDGSR